MTMVGMNNPTHHRLCNDISAAIGTTTKARPILLVYLSEKPSPPSGMEKSFKY
jgi:hypothetical protein